MQRPHRLRLPDFAGRAATLPDSAESWRHLGREDKNAPILLLGIGPAACPPMPALVNAPKVYWLEAPQVLAALPASPPSAWQNLDEETALALARECSIFFYRPGLRLAPQFWSGLLARMELAIHPPLLKTAAPMAWLPGSASLLLHQELRAALQNAGYEVCETDIAGASLQEMSAAFAGHAPHLAISVNFRGLDANGSLFELLRANGVPLAIWLVDNPFNLLSGIPLPWWREAALFVTDNSFISPLRQYGAQNVHYLPLAAAPHFGRARPQPGGPLFVGRSAFPRKEKFFSGVRIDKNLLDQSFASLSRGETPDFHWWAARCHAPLWPGLAERQAALGAETCSRLRRAAWLSAALPCGLRIAGDAGWAELLPGAAIMPPVDYYGSLAALYAGAECCLNVTSLLLPQSLSQRHFDVWQAGGFLLSDATMGMEIFPDELTRPVTLAKAADFAAKLEDMRQKLAQKAELAAEWRQLILQKHQYSHRLEAMLAAF